MYKDLYTDDWSDSTSSHCMDLGLEPCDGNNGIGHGYGGTGGALALLF